MGHNPFSYPNKSKYFNHFKVTFQSTDMHLSQRSGNNNDLSLRKTQVDLI